MEFWTPERCKTIPTHQLLEHAHEIAGQAKRCKNLDTIDRKLAILKTIEAELLTRVWK